MQGTPKAIEIKGIVRNATVIGAQDGQAEDLINLRFMDGSWRASGDGRLINFTMGTQYTQLYVHTNVYHHLLGVAPDPNNNDTPTLWWFAEIGTDGVTFYPLDGTTSRTDWPQDMQSLPTSPVALTTVVGDIWITQTGHLLTIIDENDDFEYFVFKTGEKKYIEVNLDANGKPSSRSLFPFGQVHFNHYSPKPTVLFKDNHVANLTTGQTESQFTEAEMDILKQKYLTIKDCSSASGVDEYRDILKVMQGELRGQNKFTGAMLVCCALRLCDGSYLFASNPVLINPREQTYDKSTYYKLNQSETDYELNNFVDAPGYDSYIQTYGEDPDDGLLAKITYDYNGDEDFVDHYHVKVHPFLRYYTIARNAELDIAKIRATDLLPPVLVLTQGARVLTYFAMMGYDLVISVSEIDALIRNKDVFSKLCIFATPEADVTNIYNETCTTRNKILSPRSKEDVSHDLLHSPMFLLKEYDIEALADLQKECIVDISGRLDEGLLEYDNIVQRDRLPIEAFPRTTYIPKVSYMYNSRLHIANYKSYPFFGYPIDLFHMHNHSVKVQADAWFPANATGRRVLPNITGFFEYRQYAKASYDFPSTIPSGLKYYAYIQVTIETAQGNTKVVRHIEPYTLANVSDGYANFIESLNPLLTYPDARAKEMEIRIFKEETTYQGGALYLTYSKIVQLKPHPYLNMAYYIDPDLKPIALATNPSPSSSYLDVPDMVNTEEYFPNGLKVSKTDNPMFFPVENAYQVGSAEILALMSNTIAVGTGQTGAAPLYVFCKDGVYALFVDDTGMLTYKNARVLARDVCNNPRSVTPIDAGVVFTTDRGLMMIAGEQVEEIGQPAEGDVLQYVDSTKVDYSKIASDALTKIAGLPSSLCDTTDFLTYLQGAIVNYNHNMRELIVTNPNKSYSYVLDRDGNWSRRDYTAAEYVNNYPTSYRVVNEGTAQAPDYKFYKLDDEGDASTSLEHRKEADNQIFYLSNVIKLDSIGFKQAYRFVVRGYFEAQPYADAVINGVVVYIIDKGSNNTVKGKNIGDTISLRYMTNWGNTQWVNDASGFPANIRVINKATGADVTDTIVTADSSTTYTFTRKATEIGIVVEGSYDGIKFAPLGFNRRTGKFTDIGCNVSHVDVRFYRVLLCGQVTGKTRINNMELSTVGSKLNTKIR